MAKKRRTLIIHREFADLLLACWQRSQRLTVIFWTFITVACYDEAHGFITHHGTAYHLYVTAKAVWQAVQFFIKP